MNELMSEKDTATYRRFIRMPKRLATVLSCVVVLAGSVAIASISVDYWVSCLLGCMVGASTPIIYQTSVRAMIRERLWEWLNAKIGSWDEVEEWLVKTPADELDRLAGLPDDSWMP